MSTHVFPQAREDGVVVRELPDEVLVYDLERHKAHCLNSTAAAVWRHCDGQTAPDEIAARLAREAGVPVDEDVVWLALEDLSRLELLAAPVVRPEPGLSRAQVVRRIGVAASVLAVPAVFSVLAPTASAAVCQQSCGPGIQCTGTCTSCQSGICQRPT